MRYIRRGAPVFWIFLGIYAVVLFVCITLGLNLLTDKLTEYEKSFHDPSLPVAENVFNTYFAKGIDALCDEYCPALSPFETKDDFKTALSDFINGRELSLSEEKKQENGEYTYCVLCGEESIAEFMLSLTEEGDWQLNGISVALEPKEEVTVTVFTGDRAYINGVELTEKYETGRKETHPLNELSQAYGDKYPTEKIHEITYKVSGLYLPPDVNSHGVMQKTGDREYKSELIYHSDRAEEISERVASSAEAYLDYLYKKIRLSQTAIYIDTNSELYLSLKNTADFLCEEKENRTYQNIEISEIYFLGDNVFTCRVTLDALLDEDTDSFDVTFVFVRPDRAWMLDRVTNNPM